MKWNCETFAFFVLCLSKLELKLAGCWKWCYVSQSIRIYQSKICLVPSGKIRLAVVPSAGAMLTGLANFVGFARTRGEDDEFPDVLGKNYTWCFIVHIYPLCGCGLGHHYYYYYYSCCYCYCYCCCCCYCYCYCYCYYYHYYHYHYHYHYQATVVTAYGGGMLLGGCRTAASPVHKFVDVAGCVRQVNHPSTINGQQNVKKQSRNCQSTIKKRQWTIN